MQENRPSLVDIKNAVCEIFGVNEMDLSAKLKRRSPEKVAIGRQVISYLHKKYKTGHYKEVIQMTGYSNHTHITANAKLTIKVMSVDKEFRALVDKTEEKIASALTEAK